MKLHLLLICILLSANVVAQQHILYDTSRVEQRSFDKKTLEEYKTDKAFRYDKVYEPPKSLWDRFWSWIWYKIDQIFSTKEGKTTFKVILIVFGIAMIVFFVLKVMGMNKDGLFGRSSKESLDYNVSTEDIHTISFADAIQNAIEAGNYRLAIRLLYLQTLKNLSDKGIIDWKINKTNTDYLKEVQERQWAPHFKTLTYNFDYIWYGEMEISKERFVAIDQEFQTFNSKI